MQAEPYLNRWPLRASARALAGSFPVGALVSTLADVPDELPGSADRITDLALAGAAALSLGLLLGWIGRKHGGIVAAIKLTVISYGFWQSLVAAAYATWLAAGMDGTPDAGLIGFTGGVGTRNFHPQHHHAAPPRSRLTHKGTKR